MKFNLVFSFFFLFSPYVIGQPHVRDRVEDVRYELVEIFFNDHQDANTFLLTATPIIGEPLIGPSPYMAEGYLCYSFSDNPLTQNQINILIINVNKPYLRFQVFKPLN